LEHNAKLLRFIEESKPKVQVRAAEAKKVSPKKHQPTQGMRMSQGRAKVLLAQPLLGQLSLGKFFKPNQ
jgi:hypothetical protein